MTCGFCVQKRTEENLFFGALTNFGWGKSHVLRDVVHSAYFEYKKFSVSWGQGFKGQW